MAIFAIDFDGTMVKHSYPFIGEDIGAVPVLKALVENGHKLILWTMRDHKKHPNVMSWSSEDSSSEIKLTEIDTLQEAIDWCKERGIELYGVNENPDQTWSESPKACANFYIDDAALGVPLLCPDLDERPYVDWRSVAHWLWMNGFITKQQYTESTK